MQVITAAMEQLPRVPQMATRVTSAQLGFTALQARLFQELAQTALEPRELARQSAPFALPESLAALPWRRPATTTSTVRRARPWLTRTEDCVLREVTLIQTKEELRVPQAVGPALQESTAWLDV